MIVEFKDLYEKGYRVRRTHPFSDILHIEPMGCPRERRWEKSITELDMLIGYLDKYECSRCAKEKPEWPLCLSDDEVSYAEKWRRRGFRVTYSEVEPRMYEAREIRDGKFEAIPIVRLPTVQDMDRWVMERSS